MNISDRTSDGKIGMITAIRHRRQNVAHRIGKDDNLNYYIYLFIYLSIFIYYFTTASPIVS